MKKLILILCTLGLFLSSCSDDETDTLDNPLTDAVFVKTIIETSNGEEVFTNFTYNNDKLAMISDSEGNSEIYIYTNDVLTTIEMYADEVLESETLLEYDSDNRLIRETYTYGLDAAEVNEFSYNADGTITKESSNGNRYTYTYNILGNRIAEVHEEGDEDYSYTYDSKNNPLRNIHQRQIFELLGKATYANNILSYINTSSTAFSDDFTSGFLYNANDYPTSGSTTYNPGSSEQEVVTLQFIYEL